MILLAAPNSPDKLKAENEKTEEKKRGRRPIKVLPSKCENLIDLK